MVRWIDGDHGSRERLDVIGPPRNLGIFHAVGEERISLIADEILLDAVPQSQCRVALQFLGKLLRLLVGELLRANDFEIGWRRAEFLACAKS